MEHRRIRALAVVSAVAALAAWGACGGGGGGGADDLAADPGPADVVQDTAEETGQEVADDVPVPEVEDVAIDTPPAPKCLGQVEGTSITLAGPKAAIEVIRDKWGIPHVYASSDEDLFFAQGWVVASDRLTQMQGMRLITHGRFASAPAAGKGDVDTDVYMRLLDFKGVSETMWTAIRKDDAALKLVLESFAAGVTAYIEAAKANKAPRPIEWDALGHWDPWTPVDTLMIGRLQSWDLSFEHYTDEISMMKNLQTIQAKFGATPLAGLALDAYRTAPPVDATILPAAGSGGRGGGGRLAWLPAARRLASRFPAGYFAALADRLERTRPTEVALGGGSNNWTVSGTLTANGQAMLAGDPHLSLRNPPVFYQVHLNTVRAGGDLDIAGVCFPGIPGVILGHSQHGAWMGTVHNYDVTDVYVETFSKSDPASVVFNGADVATTVRKETIEYAKPPKGCADWIAEGGLAAGLAHEVKEEAGRCILTVDVIEVPHHGPIIPGSQATLPDGTKIALAWKWTGFEPSGDLKAVAGLWRAKTVADFQNAIRIFGVGAQNWIWAGTDGHIAWAPWARLPIRKHVAEGKGAEHPPWLPMPGDGCCEWTGDVPREQLPHAEDPAEGYVATANNDPNGTTLDNDPLNDGIYYAHTYDIGFRGARVHERLRELFKAKKASIEDFQAVQGDHRSPLGKGLTPGILAAVTEAKKADADASLKALLTADVQAAADLLAQWDFQASSGLETETSAAQKGSAAAATVFNLWLVETLTHVLADKGIPGLEDQYAAKLLYAMIVTPEKLATWSAEKGDTLLWDDVATADVVETRHHVILKGLGDALARAKDPEKLNLGADMTGWLWGKLHSITLRHPLGGELNIPPESAFPTGYPRHGDSFVVDSSNAGLKDFDFRYAHGPSMRAVYRLDPAGVKMDNALPGGQSGNFPNPHYGDDFLLWAKNQTHPVHFDEASIVTDSESCLLLAP